MEWVENGNSRGIIMAILKSEIRNKYSQIPNSVIRAKDVTDGDYRLLIYLYSLLFYYFSKDLGLVLFFVFDPQKDYYYSLR